jgi:hypothetical protein
MGIWARVDCVCTNRGPISASDAGNSRILTFPCGHRDGALYQSSPNGLIRIARFLKSVLKDHSDWASVFELFEKLSCWPHWPLPQLSVAEAKQWLLELDELDRLDEGRTDMPSEVVGKWRDESHRHGRRLGDSESVRSFKDEIEIGRRLCQASIASGNPINFER